MKIRHVSHALFTLLLAGAACSPVPERPVNADASADAADAAPKPDTPAPDVGPDRDVRPSGPVVEIDLSSYLGEPGTPTTKVYQLEGDAPFTGPVIQGGTGDWVIENERARFLIEGDKRAMSPCPWGGTVIDAAYLEGGTDEDNLGEVCQVTNGALSFRPDRFDVLHDGSDGRAAVLAASGTFVINDFLNLPVMADSLVEGLSARIALDFNEVPPTRITTYYVLTPGSTGLTVVTAFRNDGDEQQDLLPALLVASGGNGYYFNPLSSSGGFGGGASAAGIALDRFPFLIFNGETASYGILPQPDERIRNLSLPVAGSYIVISNAAALILGSASILTLTQGAEQLAASPDVVHIQPGGTQVLEHTHFVGSGSLATMIDPMYAKLAEYQPDRMSVARLRGVVKDTDGVVLAGARVTAVRKGRTTNQAISAADGTFEMDVPIDVTKDSEQYEITARKGGMPPSGHASATIAAGEVVDLPDVLVEKAATIRVRVSDPIGTCDGQPTPIPARLTVMCDGDCPNAPSARERDVTFHRLPGNIAAIEYGGVDGLVETQIPAGTYRIAVSRGMEWSVWPTVDSANGVAVTVAPGEVFEADVEITRVIDTPRSWSGDFHIHTINSTDSTVSEQARVLNFAAEGLEVMVSTDHDFIADYRPAVAALGAGSWIQAVVGEEITTADLGHFNAFPLQRDPEHTRGGAVDWGNGDDFGLTPEALFDAVDAHPGEQVLQMNHADGLGLVNLATIDVLRGISYGSREEHRLPPQPTDPVTGDTGIWTERFTAMEVFNGNSLTGYRRLSRWWMTMLGRGFTPTATGVTDTHKLYGDLGIVPRTYVAVDEDDSCHSSFQNVADVDDFVARFTRSVNEGRALVTNGPYFTVSVRNSAGDTASMGDVLATGGEPVIATIEVQVPEWISADELRVTMNPDPDDVITGAGQLVEDPLPAQQVIPIDLAPEDIVVVATTGSDEHRAYRKSFDVTLETSDDAFVIFTVEGRGNMWPVVGATPLAFSNPVYLDADGNGYDNPPYRDLALTPPPPPPVAPCSTCPGDVAPRGATPEEIFEVIHGLDCEQTHAEREGGGRR